MKKIYLLPLMLLASACKTTADSETAGKSKLLQDLHILAFGDSGKLTPIGDEVAKGMAKVCNALPCAAAIMLGDNFYEDGVESVDDPLFDTYFEKRYADLNLKFYPVVGNHDLHDKGKAKPAEKAKFQSLYSQKSRKWQMINEHYYEWSPEGRPDVRFFAINTEPDFLKSKTDPTDVYKIAAALEQGLKKSQATWNVVYAHRPLYSTGAHGRDYQPQLAYTRGVIKDLVCEHADLYVSGHEHDLQVLEADCGTKPNLPLVVSGASSDRRDTGFISIPESKWFKDQLGFAVLSFSAETVSIQMFDKDGIRFAGQNHQYAARKRTPGKNL